MLQCDFMDIGDKIIDHDFYDKNITEIQEKTFENIGNLARLKYFSLVGLYL